MKLIIFLVVVVAVILAWVLSPTPEPPEMKDGWWGRGKGDASKDDPTIKDFKVNVPQSVLDDLQVRLKNARLSETLEDVKFHYGFPATYLKEVVQHWMKNFDWRKQEQILNRFPHFKTQIEGIDVHFIRVKPVSNVGKKTRPLLIVHGWPGSVWEFYKLIPMLTDPVKYGGSEEDAFELIIPSIPGYGFSEAPHKMGFDQPAAARVFAKLMQRLGFERYYVQGGDWGSAIVTIMAQAYPDRISGIHVNMFHPTHKATVILHQLAATLLPSIFLSKKVDRERWPGFPASYSFLLEEGGYFHIQATKPDTVGAGLMDSPAGLAAYILEKFSTWTDPANKNEEDGGLTRKYTLDELLTNVMIYWVTGSITSSQRFYKARYTGTSGDYDNVPVKVPAGLAAFPHEVVICPEVFAAYKFKDIVQFTDMPSGGHFPAFEEPSLLAKDIQNFVRKVENRKPKV